VSPETIGETRVAIRHDGDVVAARQEGRALAARLGFASGEQVLIATAISEVTRNIIMYAGTGEVLLDVVGDGVKRGIRIVARDEGPGIPDVALAVQDGYSTGKSLGLGLPGSKRLMDDFKIDSTVGKGTTVTMTKWAP
jgi:serine/threonine-protein kinase RsbT